MTIPHGSRVIPSPTRTVERHWAAFVICLRRDRRFGGPSALSGLL